jgi:predicted RNase H-like nuclease
MRAVLGIDPAWTVAQPSGVALLVERKRGWRCVALAPSYADFLQLASGRPVDWSKPRMEGGLPEPSRLVEAAQALAPRAELAAVAVDMPLAHGPITGRRSSDDQVSRRFGAAWCGTHSASPSRPGKIADSMRKGFGKHGFALAVDLEARPPAILEVFPHTALLALTGESRRLEYKVARSRRYWPGLEPQARGRRLLGVWQGILQALRREMDIELALPARAESLSGLKRYEDALDALVCAWVATKFLKGEADPLGDDKAAIWTPRGARRP